MPYSDAQRTEDVFLLFNLDLAVGAAGATRFNFRVPVGCTVQRIDASALAADGTDNYTAALRTGTTALFTTAAVNAANTIVSDTTIAADQSAARDVGETLNVLLAYTGTAANITDIVVQVWAVRR